MNIKQFNNYTNDNDMEIKLTHPNIVDFYHQYPHIDCEFVNLSIINIIKPFLNDSKLEKDTSLIEKIFSKLTAMENFMQSNDPDKDNISKIIKKYLDETKLSVIDSVNSSSKDLMNNTKNDNIHQLIQPIMNAVANNIDTKFQILQSQIIQPISNQLNESENRVNNRLENIHKIAYDNSNTTGSLNKDLSEYLNRILNSSFKGQYGENKLKMILNSLYPQGNLDEKGLTQTSHTKKSGDFILNRGDLVPKILIENKEYDSKKVPDDEVRKFIRDVEEQKCHGIMLSQHNDISSKANYHIDIHKKHLLLYINNVNYDSNKIHLGINTIDFLHQKLLPYLDNDTDSNDKKSISNSVLDKINEEYQTFMKQKEALFTLMEDNHKKLKQHVTDIQMPGLDDLLSQFYASAQDTQLTCKYCGKIFKGRNPKKAIARHEPSCTFNPNSKKYIKDTLINNDKKPINNNTDDNNSNNNTNDDNPKDINIET